MTRDMTQDDGVQGWVTVAVAGRALGRSPRTVQRLVAAGVLEARQQKHGRTMRSEVSIESVQRLRDQWVAEGRIVEQVREGSPAEGSPDLSGVYERLAQDLAAARERAARAETRLELTAEADTSLREELEDEKLKRINAQEEAKALRWELDRERRKSWWRRLLG